MPGTHTLRARRQFTPWATTVTRSSHRNCGGPCGSPANGAVIVLTVTVPGRCGVHTPLTVPCGPAAELQLRIFGSELTSCPHG